MESAADEAGSGSSSAQRITRVSVTGSRTIEAATFFERTYTVFKLEGEVEGVGRPGPIVSERRFAEIADFHSVWCEPMMSPDRPVFLPPKEPVSFVMKNDAALVAGRVVAIQDWANAAIEMSQRLGHPPLDSALQKFLRGADELAWKAREGGPMPPGAVVFDAAGEWIFYATVEFGGESFSIPHRLRLSSDGVNAAMLCEGHPQADGVIIRGKGTWETVQEGAAVSVALTVEVHRRAAEVPLQSEPEPSLEPELKPARGGSPTAAAAAAAGMVVASTQECKMLLKKDLQEASGLNALITRPDAPYQWRLVRTDCDIGEITTIDGEVGMALASNAARRDPLTPSDLSWCDASVDRELFWLPPHFDKPQDVF